MEGDKSLKCGRVHGSRSVKPFLFEKGDLIKLG